ncbi:MAG: hypothetical protein HRT51_00260 [Colwellia sp.]|nr:hypothetical protein [Colwellia sp.]
MIDMSGLYTHADYPAALNRFNTSNNRKKWSKFKDVHLSVTNHKCPICECSLRVDELLSRPSGRVVEEDENTDAESKHTIGSTVDHYRPQTFYDFLALTPKNYILMCSECNNIYKGCEFPLFGTSPVRAQILAEVTNELPLIVNPINDNLLDLFQLVVRRDSSGRKVLELSPKHTQGYLYEKALTTIKLFCLGDCELNAHSNPNVKKLRISLLHSHFVKFDAFIDAYIDKNIPKMRAEIADKNLKDYGFFKFILKNQFKNLM